MLLGIAAGLVGVVGVVVAFPVLRWFGDVFNGGLWVCFRLGLVYSLVLLLVVNYLVVGDLVLLFCVVLVVVVVAAGCFFRCFVVWF